MDAFYASVEQRDDPTLRGRPVAVGHAAARGVVAAASYEARRFGVHSAMPSVTALRRCPDLVFVPPRFEAYRAVSRQIHAIFARHTALIQPLSLDEAYLDVTEAARAAGSARAVAEAIRAAIRAETGLTASAGVSYNKFLAKLASDHNKPDGLFVITPRAAPDFVAGLKIEAFHGIGPSTAARMHALGIFTGADLRAADPAALTRHFGKAGAFYAGLARAEDDRPVNPDREAKSIGAERTFAADLTRLEEAEAALAPLAARVFAACARGGHAGRTVTVKVKFADFHVITRARSLPEPPATETALRETARALLRGVVPPPMGIRLLGVSLSNCTE
ncbi:MAG: DNA polymerase IV, partial [Rhodospirillales bacterium]|nr:DNA polymerase IV [Rhodospirillales bacterium]